MNTKSLTSVTAAIMFGVVATPLYAEKVDISGFVDMQHNLVDGTVNAPATSPAEQRFTTDAELDFKAHINNKAYAKIDVDLNMGAAAIAEQAYIHIKPNATLNIKAGLFNNILSWEAEDSRNLFQITHGQIWEIFDDQTENYGNNFTGMTVSVRSSNITFMGGLLNDLDGVNEEISLLGLVRLDLSNDLTAQVGLVTQDQNAESLVDFNLTFKQNKMTLAGELLLAGEIFDMGLGIVGNFQVTPELDVTARYDNVSYDFPNADDTSSLSIAGGYKFMPNLTAKLELRINDNSNPGNFGLVNDGEQVWLQLLASF